MNIKLDENLPLLIASNLNSLGHDVHAVHQEGPGGCTDQELWSAVQREGRFLITQDLDFADVRQFAPGTHHGVLLVRLHSPSRHSLIQRVTELFQIEDVTQWKRCFVVATERKVRVRRPT